MIRFQKASKKNPLHDSVSAYSPGQSIKVDFSKHPFGNKDNPIEDLVVIDTGWCNTNGHLTPCVRAAKSAKHYPVMINPLDPNSCGEIVS